MRARVFQPFPPLEDVSKMFTLLNAAAAAGRVVRFTYNDKVREGVPVVVTETYVKLQGKGVGSHGRPAQSFNLVKISSLEA